MNFEKQLCVRVISQQLDAFNKRAKHYGEPSSIHRELLQSFFDKKIHLPSYISLNLTSNTMIEDTLERIAIALENLLPATFLKKGTSSTIPPEAVLTPPVNPVTPPEAVPTPPVNPAMPPVNSVTPPEAVPTPPVNPVTPPEAVPTPPVNPVTPPEAVPTPPAKNVPTDLSSFLRYVMETYDEMEKVNKGDVIGNVLKKMGYSNVQEVLSKDMQTLYEQIEELKGQ
ncbi:MAG: hypothetical protein KZQ66_04575 [Candidatus Thiodiazotropha sp. (ex Lucinoma aequizonata)]|nr:hypothetical protein [Candidatus Thiodiazotropha sp. (ex Lucinoma aequizonata)]MCU7899673.1 hypothetical protein [Candidatus Thiodiazotropha sp. (ex Lucinoma aequizonata)]MCU7901357.1 hypothetical protein [Candidatus Thiodiazotropha sp. (ex Lucinoma aequizonata)]MCU7910396.1 hypothetical protein [Candidatus Thiodiazotropha sp. (ex Lucinoma aequizonata)]MCU7913606.1 hypothetical protein [Candidatus Thiodiazotropha sp. (ex Lucinoma aequizonata)]